MTRPTRNLTGIGRRTLMMSTAAVGAAAVIGRVAPTFATSTPANLSMPFQSPPTAAIATSGASFDTVIKVLTDHIYTTVSAAGGQMPAPDIFDIAATTDKKVTFNGVDRQWPTLADASPSAVTDTRPVAPTINAKQGGSFAIAMTNTMNGPAATDAMCPAIGAAAGSALDKPHGFYDTNMHTHGLHLNPGWPGDNVVTSLAPTKTPVIDTSLFELDDWMGQKQDLSMKGGFPYIYYLDPEHPAGTFWYHPHKHGSVAGQQTTGMAGALIVRGDYDDMMEKNGIRTGDGPDSDEKVLVLQTLSSQYIPDTADPEKGTPAPTFDPSLYYYGVPAIDNPLSVANNTGTTDPALSPGASVNGMLSPNLSIKAGRMQLWRIVNAAVGTTFTPVFYKMVGATPVVATEIEVYVTAVDAIAIDVGPGGNGATVPYKVDPTLARDENSSQWQTQAELITVTAGQRLDILVKVPETAAGQSYAFGYLPTTSDALSLVSKPGRLSQQSEPLVFVTVEAAPASAPAQTVPTAAEMAALSRPPIPFPDTLDTKSLSPTQSLSFDSAVSPMTIEGMSFDPATSTVPLALDAYDVWQLYADNGAHMFHIHVNSFRMMARRPTANPAGSTSTIPPDPLGYDIAIYRDVVFFENNPKFSEQQQIIAYNNNLPSGGTPKPSLPNAELSAKDVFVASYQLDYSGQYVLHCHNTFHEDSGMMLLVQVGNGEAGPIVKGSTPACRTET